MKNLIIAFLFSLSVNSQIHTVISNKFYSLNDDNSGWKESMGIKTTFSISKNVISFSNKIKKEVFYIISEEQEFTSNQEDRVRTLYCRNLNNQEVDVMFFISKLNKRLIYILYEDTTKVFEID